MLFDGESRDVINPQAARTSQVGMPPKISKGQFASLSKIASTAILLRLAFSKPGNSTNVVQFKTHQKYFYSVNVYICRLILIL